MMKYLCGVLVLALVVPASANLLDNGTFDNGMTSWTYGAAGWGAAQNLPLSAGASTGVHGPSTHADDPAAQVAVGQDYSGSRWEAQTVTNLVPGTTYTLSGMIAGGAGGAQANQSNLIAWWQIGYYPGAYDASTLDSGTGATNVVDVTYPGGTDNFDFDWVSGSGQFTATQSTYTIYIKYGATNTNWNYYGVFTDNIELTPEPASLVLLGLGGLAMLRRRR